MLLGPGAGRTASRSRDRDSCSPHDVYTCQEFALVLERERARADRNGHGFSLVTFDSGDRGPAFERKLKRVLRGRLRLTDQLGWYDGQRIGVLLFNTGGEGAWDYAARVREAMTSGPGPECGVYTYPVSWPGPKSAKARPAKAEPLREKAPESVAAAVSAGADPLESAPLPGRRRALDLIVAHSLLLLFFAPLMAVFSRRGAYWLD